ncbi:MAG: alpha/beta hydrolase [Caulobacteraceae bacterium]|nr:alpha/beta hydrolase [Caulobacteraceae bacterium]
MVLRLCRLLAFSLLLVAAPAMAADLWRTVPPTPALTPGGTSGFVTENGARIWYAAYGEGPPVILLHGGLANSDYWGQQIPVLARTHRVVVIDSRGHGRSSRDQRPYTYELMASDVIGVMDALKIDKAAVVGWSDGAIIGLVMAMKDPARVSRVFAFAANMDPSGVRADAMTTPTFGGFGARAAREYAKLSPTPDGFVVFSAAIQHMWDTEPNYTAADLARITVPAAIVDGDHDEAIKAEHTAYLARAIPGARLIILPGLSHFAMLQDPVAFNAAVLGFLDQR